MKKYINFLDKNKWWIAILVPIMILSLGVSLKNLSFEGSYRIWFAKDSKILTNYDKFRQTFGNDDSVIIVFKDPNGIFNKKAISSIQRITAKLWKTKYITRVDSLTSYQYIHASKDDPDDILVEDFIKGDLTPNYLQQRAKLALTQRQLVGSFISKDETTTMISARLTPKAGEKEDISFELMGYINKILETEHAKTGYKYWVNGGAALTTSFVTIAQKDGSTFTPMIFISVFVLLLLLFRRVSGALIPLSVVVLTIIAVLSVQVLLGYKLNNFTANIPVFIIAIGIADAVHIYSVWSMYRGLGVENKEAVYKTLSKNFQPIFLTSLTTAIGFLSLAISHIVPVKTLGLATSSAAVLAFILSVFYMPTLLLFLKKSKVKTTPKKQSFVLKYKKYASFIVSSDKKIVLFITVIFIFLGLGLTKVKVDSNTIRYFEKNVEIRKSTEFIMKNLTGPMSYEIVVDSGEKDGIKDPKFLKTVDRFYKEFQAKFSDIRHLNSLLDVVKEFHKVMHSNDEKYYKVPDNKNLIAQYLLLYSMSLPQGMEINDKMDIKQRLLRVTAQVNLVDTSKDLQMLGWIKSWWAKTPYKVELNGQTQMFAFMQKDVTDTLIYSISMALGLVSIIMIAIFKDIKMLFIFILPNILPLILVVGVMGWLGINIDLGVAVAGAIIIGVAVDDTIHFFSKYFLAKKEGLNIEDRLSYVFTYSGKAMLYTTIILTLSFALFMGSDFAPNFNFGLITASALIIALMADLVLLPALLSWRERVAMLSKGDKKRGLELLDKLDKINKTQGTS